MPLFLRGREKEGKGESWRQKMFGVPFHQLFYMFFLPKYRFFYNFRMVVSDDFKIILEKKGKIIFYLIKQISK
jgi:hypothetical protein